MLTGALQSMTRDETVELIRSYCGMVSSSVSKKTGYVVVRADLGSKYEKARELNVPVMTEEELKGEVRRNGGEN